MNKVIKNNLVKIGHSIIAFIVAVVVIVLTIFFVYYDAYGTNMFAIPKDMNKKVQNFNQQSMTDDKGGIVFFGDSLTEFCDLDKWYPDLDCINRGISMDTTSGMLKRLEGNVLALQPSVLVFLGGTNDIDDGTSAQTIVENIRQICNLTKESFPDCRIIVQSLYPVNKDKKPYFLNRVGSRTNETIIQINNLLWDMCNEHGWQYVDLFSILVDEEGNLHEDLTMDGLHINDIGYKLVSNAILPYIDIQPV